MSTYRKPYQGRLSPHKSLEQVSSREIVPPAFKTVAPPLGGGSANQLWPTVPNPVLVAKEEGVGDSTFVDPVRIWKAI